MLRRGRTVVGTAMNSKHIIPFSIQGDTQIVNPVQRDNQCCKGSMNHNWQPNTINDRSID
jgi:hypothetical protein